ncbi:MAG: exodeoxyribonuclease VII large subunit [Betaproteobacteria bacterium]
MTGDASAHFDDPGPTSRPPVDGGPRQPPVLPVGLLVSSARLLLERHLGLVWVAGEISNFTRAASGHCYFNLKDAQAQVRCAFFRNKAQFAGFTLKDGLAVEVRATATVYEARGEFQLNVDAVRLAGVGALYERFARLKARLEAQGWFEPARKRPLPPYPRAIGIVTSPRAAAFADVLTTLARRWPALAVILYPTRVQGDGAAAEIAQAIRLANARAEVELLLVCRGGGSVEDLWAFNEEAVAQAVFESTLPVVSGVGHETDFTICDFVADVRAPTPTGAAAMVTPDRADVERQLAALVDRWRRTAQRTLEARMQRVDGAARRLVHPAAKLAQQSRDAGLLAGRLRRAFAGVLAGMRSDVAGLGHRFALRVAAPLPQTARVAALADGWRRTATVTLGRATTRVAALEQSLGHLDPRAVLERGYAIVSAEDGTIVVDAARVSPGDQVTIGFARGSAGARITRRE